MQGGVGGSCRGGMGHGSVGGSYRGGVGHVEVQRVMQFM